MAETAVNPARIEGSSLPESAVPEGSGRDRRRTRRWSPPEVPWLVSVQFLASPAELINVSVGGALVRTHMRPQMRPLAAPLDGRHLESVNRLAFDKESGERIGTAGRLVRREVARVHSGAVLYDVAFRFDVPPPLELPEVDDSAPTCAEDATSAVEGSPSDGPPGALVDALGPLRGIEAGSFFLLSGGVTRGSHPPDVAARLSAVESMLLRIRSTMREVIRTNADARLRQAVGILALCVPRLLAMRADLLERAARDARAPSTPIADAADLDEELRLWHLRWR